MRFGKRSFGLALIVSSIACWPAVSADVTAATRAASPPRVKIQAKTVPWVAWGSRIGVTGTVTPVVPRLIVVLQQQRGTEWEPVATGRLRANGSFLLVTRPRKPGRAIYRVVTPRKSARARGASATFVVRVLQKSYLNEQDEVDYQGSVYTGTATVNGRTFGHPIGIDSDSTYDGWVDYNLGRRAELFTASVGIVDTCPSGVTATFSVIVDGRQVAGGNLSLGMLAPVRVSVSGAFRIRLAMNSSGTYENSDCFVVFGDPQLLAG